MPYSLTHLRVARHTVTSLPISPDDARRTEPLVPHQQRRSSSFVAARLVNGITPLLRLTMVALLRPISTGLPSA
jgi:hypothetical protein